MESPRLEYMCGIVGYVGSGDCQDILMSCLARLEYRGYDSAGLAIVQPNGNLWSQKRAGKLKVLSDHLSSLPPVLGQVGVAHTRWATHGEPNDTNAHPHLADGGKLALIHNGIIENYEELKSQLRSDG